MKPVRLVGGWGAALHSQAAAKFSGTLKQRAKAGSYCSPEHQDFSLPLCFYSCFSSKAIPESNTSVVLVPKLARSSSLPTRNCARECFTLINVFNQQREVYKVPQGHALVLVHQLPQTMQILVPRFLLQNHPTRAAHPSAIQQHSF